MTERTADIERLRAFLQDIADSGATQRYVLHLLRDGADMVVGWCDERLEIKFKDQDVQS